MSVRNAPDQKKVEENWKSLPLIDEELVKFLRKKFPPLEWERGLDQQTYLNDAIFRAGCIEAVNTLDHIMQLQRKKNKH